MFSNLMVVAELVVRPQKLHGRIVKWRSQKDDPAVPATSVFAQRPECG